MRKKGTFIPQLYLPKPTLPSITNALLNFSCNFDQNVCGMKQDKVDDLDFVLQKGSTPSKHTGPSSDHTSGEGTAELCQEEWIHPNFNYIF